MRKRILASLMALILALSLLPTAALATGETQEPEQEAQMSVSENGTEGGGEDATIPVETGDETGTTDETETTVITTPTATTTDATTPVETLTPVVQTIEENDVAAIGDQGYKTLAAAISAAEKNDVVVMLKDIQQSSTVTVDAVKQLTLDLNGYTITGSGNFTILINNGVLTLKDSKGQGGISSDSNVPVAVGSNSTTTIESGTYTGREGAVITSLSVGATINIQGGTFKATDNAVIAGNGSDRTGDGNTINISGGTFEGGITTEKYVACGIYAPWKDTFNITGGNFTITGGAGIVARAGQVNISGDVTITTTTRAGLTDNKGKVGDSRIVVPCSALVFDSEAGYPGMDSLSKITVEGGNFTSEAAAVSTVPASDEEIQRISITGGTFSTKPSEAYIPSGYEATKTAAGWEVAAKDGMEANVTAPGAGVTNSSATVTGSFSGYEQAGGEAGEGSVEADGGSVTINVQTGSTGEGDNKQPAPNGQVSSTTVTVDTASVSSVAKKKVDVTLQTDVADLKIPSEAWNSMADAAGNDSVVIAVTENTNGTTTWTVTAKAGTTDVFTEDSAATITVTVKYDSEAENVVVYCTDNGQQEQMKTTWDQAAKTLSWETPHFSTFAPVTYSSDTKATWITASGTSDSGSLEQAVAAMQSGGGTITLVDNVTLEMGNTSANSAVITLPAGTTLDGGFHQIIAGDNWTAGQCHILGVSDIDGSVTVKNLTIVGNENTKHGFNAWGKNNTPVVTLENVAIQNCGTAGVVVNHANVTATNLTTEGNAWGGVNVDNGGQFNLVSGDLREPSQIWSEDAAEAESGSKITVPDSWQEVTVNKAGDPEETDDVKTHYTTDITRLGEATVVDRDDETGKVTVYDTVERALTATSRGENPAGGRFPQVTVIRDAEVTGNPMVDDGVLLVVNDGVELTIPSGSALLNHGTIENNGTITGTVNMQPGTGECFLQYMIDGQIVYAKSMSVDPDTGIVDRWVEDLPTNPGYTLSAWTCTDSSVTATTVNGYAKWSGVQSGETYVFNAYWIANPTPVVPDDNTPSYSGGSSSSETSYSNTIDASDGGSVKVSPRTPSRGETVTITPTPDTGYEVDEVIVTDRNGDEVEVTANRNGTYTFEQPRGRVTIEVTFVRTGGTAGAAPFLDVAEDAWYADAVAYVYDNGLMSGTSTTLFSPNATTTRGMIVTMLYRLEGEPRISSGSAFDDVDAGMYYADAVAWASQNDIVTGYDEATFGPNNAITREQMAAILYRYAQYKGYRTTADADLSGYVDADSVSSYALASLQWANAAGLVTGTSSNTLTPDGSATRAQVATIFMRFMEDVAE